VRSSATSTRSTTARRPTGLFGGRSDGAARSSSHALGFTRCWRWCGVSAAMLVRAMARSSAQGESRERQAEHSPAGSPAAQRTTCSRCTPRSLTRASTSVGLHRRHRAQPFPAERESPGPPASVPCKSAHGRPRQLADLIWTMHTPRVGPKRPTRRDLNTEQSYERDNGAAARSVAGTPTEQDIGMGQRLCRTVGQAGSRNSKQTLQVGAEWDPSRSDRRSGSGTGRARW